MHQIITPTSKPVRRHGEHRREQRVNDGYLRLLSWILGEAPEETAARFDGNKDAPAQSR